MLKLIIIGSIPTADGYIFTGVMGRVLGVNIDLPNYASTATFGFMTL
jgi:hypothetical protein